jgi:CDP-4-dehydro-6-deoxyglucose reductase, E1
MSGMTCEIHPGGIYKIPFPFTDLLGTKARPALAISAPDSHGDVKFAFITRLAPQTTNDTMELQLHHYDGQPLPFQGFLRLDKIFLLNRSIVLNKLAILHRHIMADIQRKLILQGIPGFYAAAHPPGPFVPGTSRISYGGRVFDEREIATLVDASLDFWLTAGRYAERFERGFASFLGIKHCSLTNSGSSANLLAFMALTSLQLENRRIKKGDEVITVGAAFPTTVAPIIQFGAVPVFVDIEVPGYNIDCTQLEAALSDKTKAVVLAHTLGNPFDLQRVKGFCDRHGLWLIEDNCDALGSRYRIGGEWKYTGTVGHMGTSSFYPPHHITMGEGGAVCTNDATLKRLVESLRDWGRDCWCPSGRDNTCGRRFDQKFGELPLGYDHKYVYSHFGYNLKATEMQAAIGCAQLERLPEFIKARKRNWQLVRDGLVSLSDCFVLPEPTPNTDPSWFGFLLTVREDAGFTRDDIVTYLEAAGIQTRMLFAGNILKHPCFDEMRRNGAGYRVVAPSGCLQLPVTDMVMNQSFWLGVYPGMQSSMIEFVVEQIVRFVRGRKAK